MAAPRRAPPLRSVLFPRSQAGDLVDVGAIDADVVQLAVRIGRKSFALPCSSLTLASVFVSLLSSQRSAGSRSFVSA